MAEEVGFEPTMRVAPHTRFRVVRLQPAQPLLLIEGLLH